MDYTSSRSRKVRKRKSISFVPSELLLVNRLIKFALVALVAVVVGVPLLFLWYSRDLPAPGKIIVPKYTDATRIYDRKGALLYSVYQDENRTYTKLSGIPQDLQHATISIEDKTFYT